MTGMIQGGWEFVQAAYGVSIATLAIYAISMELRIRKEKP